MTCIHLQSRTITTTFLIFLSALSSATAYIQDTDGEPLFNGGQYYIIPQSVGTGGGLALKSKTEASPCPLYITRNRDETSQGIPVTITSPTRSRFIAPSTPVTIVFNAIPTICRQPLGWQVILDKTTGQSYITTGGREAYNPIFTIQPIKGTNNVYKLRNFGASDAPKDVGFFKNDGLLGITNEIPLPVVFKNALGVVGESKHVLQM